MGYISLLILILIATAGQGIIVLDTWTSHLTIFYGCLNSKGYTRIVLRLESKESEINADDVRNIVNARNSGLEVQPAVIPCSAKTPQAQADRLVKSLPATTFSRVWAAPWQTTGSCSWRTQAPSQNCDYLQRFIKAMQTHNISVGVYTSKDSWPQLFGSINGCPQVNTSALWWQPLREQDDNQTNFNTYHKIGGWNTPTMKVLNSVDICGNFCDKNYSI